MLLRKRSFILYFLLLSVNLCLAQIEVARVSVKNFKAIGFGGFLNFSFPVSDANYATIEGGVQYFSKDEEYLALIPVLAGYRYTLDQSGSGIYAEPNVGYNFGFSTIRDDGYDELKVAGPAAGMTVGYLFEPGGSIQFNVGLRYEHIFANAQTNAYSIRISHAFTLGKRKDY